MRLLAVADLHYSLRQFGWVLECAPDFDVVVLAGDMLELSSLVDWRAQAVVMRKYFNRLREVTYLDVQCRAAVRRDPGAYHNQYRCWRSPVVFVCRQSVHSLRRDAEASGVAARSHTGVAQSRGSAPP